MCACSQPIEFNQLDHDRRFKEILGGILFTTLAYSLSCVAFTNLVEQGAFKRL